MMMDFFSNSKLAPGFTDAGKRVVHRSVANVVGNATFQTKPKIAIRRNPLAGVVSCIACEDRLQASARGYARSCPSNEEEPMPSAFSPISKNTLAALRIGSGGVTWLFGEK